jgi:hypothetical protein
MTRISTQLNTTSFFALWSSSMTELSPAAKTVLDAFLGDAENTGLQMDDLRENVAAALRAAADEVCLRWAELKHPADVLNTIADELEAQ